METGILELIAQEQEQNKHPNVYEKIHYIPIEERRGDPFVLKLFTDVVTISNRVKEKTGIKPQCIVPLPVFDKLALAMSGEKVWEWVIDLRMLSKDMTIPISKQGAVSMKKVKRDNFNIYGWRHGGLQLVHGLSWFAVPFCLAVFPPLGLLMFILAVKMFFVWLNSPRETSPSQLRDLERRAMVYATWPSVLLTRHAPELGIANYWRANSCGKLDEDEDIYRDYEDPSTEKAKVFLRDAPKYFERSLQKVFDSDMQPCILSAHGMLNIATVELYKQLGDRIDFDRFRREDPILYVIEKEGDTEYAAILDYYGEPEEALMVKARTIYGTYLSGLHSRS